MPICPMRRDLRFIGAMARIASHNSDGATAPYGFGWHVDTFRGHRRIRHGGGLPGFVAEYARFEDNRVTIIVLTNGDDIDLPSLVGGLAVLYLPGR